MKAAVAIALVCAPLGSAAFAADCSEKHWSIAVRGDPEKPTVEAVEKLNEIARASIECEATTYVWVQAHVPNTHQAADLIAARKIADTLVDYILARGVPMKEIVVDAVPDYPVTNPPRGAEISLRPRVVVGKSTMHPPLEAEVRQ